MKILGGARQRQRESLLPERGGGGENARIPTYPIVHVRRGDGVALGVLVRITTVVAVVLRLAEGRLRRPVILRLRRRDRLVRAAGFALRDRYRLVIGGPAADRRREISSAEMKRRTRLRKGHGISF